uniref:Claudin n=1 Tax=Cyprinodon variegatus TaxID=28743 RepID=A0A3Q2DKR6_CYPVA
MVSQGIQITAMIIATIGWLLDIVVCGLPMWKVSAFVGANIITAQTIWQGMWMNCVVQSTGQMQCKVYDSLLALSQDLQAGRAMIVISILLGICGLFLAIAGGKCTNCIEDERSKSKVCILSGVFFILSGSNKNMSEYTNVLSCKIVCHNMSMLCLFKAYESFKI